ncbi:MAG: UDP-N-acetylmuramate dehydrogenase [Parashewanella sp.]
MASDQLCSLKSHNTLGLEQYCQCFIQVNTLQSLIETCVSVTKSDQPMLILGGGSNIVFTEDFDGTVVHINTKGIEVTEDEDNFHLSIAAGENWHQLVEYCLQHDIYGLENLALIPGTVGAAPIQNIGAYGVEFKQVCDWVEYLDLETAQIYRLTVDECRFGYRDSIFKQGLKHKVVITQIGLKLTKKWAPNLSYGSLKLLANRQPTAQAIFDEVCAIRASKLPDPNIIGNVGSFFKNPIISKTEFKSLEQAFPDVVSYAHGDKIKLAAGWLIDQAGLKGFQLGQAGVHDKQALVLVNLGQGKGSDIVTLARYIMNKVAQKFAVKLEVEPRIFGKTEEISING